MKKKTKLMCCLCNKEIIPCLISGWDKGNNPAPLGEEGDRCCDDCNTRKVLPHRILQIYLQKEIDTNLN